MASRNDPTLMTTQPRDLVYKTTYGDGEDLTTAIVFAVAAAKGIDPVNIHQNLYDVVDVSALESLFEVPGGHRASPRSAIDFRFIGYHVVVQSDGIIKVYD